MNQSLDTSKSYHHLFKHYQDDSLHTSLQFSVHIEDEKQALSIASSQLLAFLLDCKKFGYRKLTLAWKSSLWQRIKFFLSQSQCPAHLSFSQVLRLLSLAHFKANISRWDLFLNFFKSNHAITALSFTSVAKESSVSIIIPCKNEAGNIERAIQELPEFDSSLEIIFVEGSSSDNTWDEIKRVQKKFPYKNIKCIKQSHKGKAAAVYDGFDCAQGDILIILDGDLTVPPSEIRYCYEVMKHNTHAFINGTRMWLPMEKHATPLLNYYANKGFAYILSLLTQRSISDTLCGTKVLSKKNYERMKELPTYLGKIDPFGDFALILGAHDLELSILEIPFNFKARTYGSTQIHRFKNGFDLLVVLGCYILKRIQNMGRKK